jgi:TRAP transporter TAXI family solute receptor
MQRAVTAAIVCLLGCGCGSDRGGRAAKPDDGPSSILRLTTGPPGGGFYPLGEHVAEALRTRMSDVEVEVIASGGAIFNIDAIQAGRADVGFTFADVAYMGYNGLLANRPAPLNRLRGVAVLQLIPISLVARRGLDIRNPRDLIGKRVSVGPAGSGTAITARLVLHEFGVDPPNVTIEFSSFQDSATRLTRGVIDAMFDNAIIPDSVTRATAAGARLVPIAGDPVDRLRQDYPFLKPAVIPAGTYPNSVHAVHTIGVDGLLICSVTLQEGLVYELTKQISTMVSESTADDPLRMLELDAAPATPIPLHPGAIRYYRERELVRQR